MWSDQSINFANNTQLGLPHRFTCFILLKLLTCHTLMEFSLEKGVDSIHVNSTL